MTPSGWTAYRSMDQHLRNGPRNPYDAVTRAPQGRIHPKNDTRGGEAVALRFENRSRDTPRLCQALLHLPELLLRNTHRSDIANARDPAKAEKGPRIRKEDNYDFLSMH